MAQRSFTVARYEEIRRRLAEGRGLREIARALGCSRDTVREVRRRHHCLEAAAIGLEPYRVTCDQSPSDLIHRPPIV